MKARIIAVASALVLILILFATCHKSPPPKPNLEVMTPPLGKNCTVQFRRDALGTASGNPVPPLTGMHNGVETAVSGKLKSVTAEWIVLDRGGSELWIPKSVVLALQY
jgi:hypothetical protein